MWKGVRYRPASHVLAELRYLRRTLGVRHIRIHDDTFGSDAEQAHDVLAGVIREELDVTFYAHSRVDVVDASLLALFRRAGGGVVYFGVESGSARLRCMMGKPTESQRIIGACRDARAAGLRVGVFLMFGYPGESYDDVALTYRLVSAIEPDDVACAVVKIQPGTRLYPYALTHGYISDDMWLNSDREYFTFCSPQEWSFYCGVQLLFLRDFVHGTGRTTFEKNNDLVDITIADRDRLAAAARAALRPAMRRNTAPG